MVKEKMDLQGVKTFSLEFYKQLIDNLPVGVVHITPEGVVTFFSNTAGQYLRLGDEPGIGRNVIEFIAEENHAAFLKRLADLKAGIPLEPFEYVLNRRDGTKLDALVKTHVQVNPQGETEGLIVAIQDITEKKKIETSLKNSEQKFRSTFEHAGIPMAVCDKYGTMVLMNNATVKLFGFPEEELKQMSIKDLTHPDDFDEDKKLYDSLMRGNIESYRIEKRDICKNGKIVWGWLTTSLVRDESGNPLLAIRMFEDITERVTAEKALMESEEKYRTLFENLITAFALAEVIYKNGKVSALRYLDVNPAYEKLTGLKADSILGRLSTEVSFQDGKFWLTKIHEILSTGEPMYFEKYIPQLNKYFYFWLFSPAKDRIATFFTDITKRKLAEEELKTSEQRFRSYFELPLIGITILSEDLTILDCNNKATQILGFSKKTLKNRPLTEFVDPNDSSFIADLKPITNGKADNHTVIKRFIRLDGSTVYAEVALGCVRNSNHSIVFYVALINDITEKTLLAAELEKHRNLLEHLVEERTLELANVNNLLQTEIIKQKEAEEIVTTALEKEKELSQLKSRFISIASHEFRTPLTTIYSSAQLLERFGKNWDDTMFKNQIDRIKEYIHHLTDIMDDVLVIGRTETGKISFEPKMVDLKAFCDNLVGDIQPLISSKHKFNYKFLLKQNIYLLDEKLLKYILLNLITNAIKYSPSGGKIEFTIKNQRKNIEFIVSDNGIGIPEQNQSILFEPFHRGDNVGEISGTGLGMSIISKAVTMHNGNISFVSRENKGTTFRVLIPKE